ncbi:hypothetical protein CXF85_13915 [Colwellia sp. 75C3]|uniref:hypothetical protein n=1 Tax=Colwellia sp. 75C3 TaxID=888425 RepID=UPI000C343EC3|nr:hypothetical protein [Colwellia sp. 75C3]PKG82573.1 hypothetical protein CXF85_13915 [Colwellia sp. 75C3]
MNKFSPLLVLTLAGFILLTQTVQSAEVMPLADKSSNKASKTEPLIIQSQVKGSQEQPNVIYIMPWKGVDQVIEVEGKTRTIKLPHFSPINPKVFKEQVRFFANKSLAVKAKAEPN